MLIRPHLTILTLAGLLAGTALAACAHPADEVAQSDSGQSGAPTAGHRHNPMQRALEGLNLSSDQQAKIDTYRQQFRASRDTNTPETRQQLMQQVEGVLTPDQKTKFEANMKAAASQWREHRMQNGATPDSSASPA